MNSHNYLEGPNPAQLTRTYRNIAQIEKDGRKKANKMSFAARMILLGLGGLFFLISLNRFIDVVYPVDQKIHFNTVTTTYY